MQLASMIACPREQSSADCARAGTMDAGPPEARRRCRGSISCRCRPGPCRSCSCCRGPSRCRDPDRDRCPCGPCRAVAVMVIPVMVAVVPVAITMVPTIVVVVVTVAIAMVATIVIVAAAVAVILALALAFALVVVLPAVVIVRGRRNDAAATGRDVVRIQRHRAVDCQQSPGDGDVGRRSDTGLRQNVAGEHRGGTERRRASDLPEDVRRSASTTRGHGDRRGSRRCQRASDLEDPRTGAGQNERSRQLGRRRKTVNTGWERHPAQVLSRQIVHGRTRPGLQVLVRDERICMRPGGDHVTRV